MKTATLLHRVEILPGSVELIITENQTKSGTGYLTSTYEVTVYTMSYNNTILRVEFSGTRQGEILHMGCFRHLDKT